MKTAAAICFAALSLAGGCSDTNAIADYEATKAKLRAESEIAPGGSRANVPVSAPLGSSTVTRPDFIPQPGVTPPPAYFGPNAIGTGTTSGPSPALPFVDSVASCAAILDAEARRLCLQRAGTR